MSDIHDPLFQAGFNHAISKIRSTTHLLLGNSSASGIITVILDSVLKDFYLAAPPIAAEATVSAGASVTAPAPVTSQASPTAGAPVSKRLRAEAVQAEGLDSDASSDAAVKRRRLSQTNTNITTAGPVITTNTVAAPINSILLPFAAAVPVTSAVTVKPDGPADQAVIIHPDGPAHQVITAHPGGTTDQVATIRPDDGPSDKVVIVHPVDPTRIDALLPPNIVSGIPAGRKATVHQWYVMGEQIGKRAAVTKGMFIAGDILVDNRSAFTIPREQPCSGCVKRNRGERCRLPDPKRETLVAGKSCDWCARTGAKCI